MGPQSYMRSVIDRNVLMRRILYSVGSTIANSVTGRFRSKYRTFVVACVVFTLIPPCIFAPTLTTSNKSGLYCRSFYGRQDPIPHGRTPVCVRYFCHITMYEMDAFNDVLHCIAIPWIIYTWAGGALMVYVENAHNIAVGKVARKVTPRTYS
jgi:hypothetical protein